MAVTEQEFQPLRRLAVEIDAIPPTLRPGNLFDHTALAVGRLLFEPLCTEGPEPGTVIPAAATTISSTDGGRTWRITLRDDLRWSDGTPITAHDVGRAIRYLAAPSGGSPLAWLADSIEGMVPARTAGNMALLDAGCLILDDTTLELRMTHPVAYAPALLANNCFAPRPQMLPGGREIPVSGPYRLAGTFPGERGLLLLPNERSHRLGSFSPRSIECIRTDGPEQGIRLFGSGRIDITCNTTFPPSLLPEYSGCPDYMQGDLLIAAQLLIHPARAECLAGARSRHALSLAIGRQEIASSLGNAIRPLWRYTGLWHPDEDSVPQRNSAAAQAIWRGNNGGRAPEITLGYADFSPNPQVVRLLAEQIEEALPLRITTQALGYHEYLRRMITGDYQMLYILTPAPFDDPASMLVPFRGGNFFARSIGYSDPLFDTLLQKAEAEEDSIARLAGYRAANDRLLETMPVFPLFRGQSMLLRRHTLRGCELPRNGIIPFERICAGGSSANNGGIPGTGERLPGRESAPAL